MVDILTQGGIAPMRGYVPVVKSVMNLVGFLSSSECGKNTLISAQRIVGAANNAEQNMVGHWPWMASIGYLNGQDKWKHQCGATLISDHHFLTAAHCVNSE